MRTKVGVILGLVALTGGLAYWFGYRQASITWHARLFKHYTDEQQARWRENGAHQALICLSALTNLDAGKKVEAGEILERHLSEGVSRFVSGRWKNPRGDEFSYGDIMLLRAARDYQLQHPRKNAEGEEREELERLEKVLKMLDAPEQVTRLKQIDEVLKSAH